MASDSLSTYVSSCKSLRMPQHPFVRSMLLSEKERHEKSSSEECQYYLGGNNPYLANRRLEDVDCQPLCAALQSNPLLVRLDLRYNFITDKGAPAIAKLIQTTTSLKYLNLMGNDFTEEGSKSLSHALHENKSIETFSMAANKIGNKGGLLFAQALQLNTTLKALDLGDADLHVESLIALATVLRYNTTLEAINVSRPILYSTQEEATVHFAEMLTVNKTLKELHLMKCDMTDFGAQRLSEHLKENFTLEYLDVSCNKLTRDGAKAFVTVLERNTGLKRLDLGFNRLGDEGAVYLAEVLTYTNKKLEALALPNNEICGRGLCALAECLKKNVSLQKVYIWGNVLEPSVCLAYRHLLDSGRLKEQNTDVRPYIVDEQTYLAQVTNGLQVTYYWLPAFGVHRDEHIAELVHESIKNHNISARVNQKMKTQSR